MALSMPCVHVRNICISIMTEPICNILTEFGIPKRLDVLHTKVLVSCLSSTHSNIVNILTYTNIMKDQYFSYFVNNDINKAAV